MGERKEGMGKCRRRFGSLGAWPDRAPDRSLSHVCQARKYFSPEEDEEVEIEKDKKEEGKDHEHDSSQKW